MITGSTPTVVWSTIRARGFRPERLGLPALHQQHRGGAVGDLRRVARRDLAVLLEGRLELGELLEGGVRADALVGHVGVAVDRNGTISRSKRPSSVACARRSGASAGRSRRARSGGSPTGRRSSRPRCPAARGCTSPAAPRGQGEPTSSTHLKPTPIGMWPMCSTPEPMAASCTPEAISAAAKLTACCAEPHWRSTVVAGVSTGSPAWSQALRPTLNICSPYCCTQPVIDVLDLGGVDPGALDDLGVGLAEQLVRVGVLVVALLRVAAPDRRADGLDDYDLAAVSVLHLVLPPRSVVW